MYNDIFHKITKFYFKGEFYEKITTYFYRGRGCLWRRKFASGSWRRIQKTGH